VFAWHALKGVLYTRHRKLAPDDHRVPVREIGRALTVKIDHA